MSHTIDIPEWMWKKFQGLSGLSNPASHIRNVLAEGLADTDAMVHTQDAAAEAEAATASSVDHGRMIVLTRRTLCNQCGLLVDVGESAVIRTGSSGAREILHAEHFRKPPACSAVD